MQRHINIATILSAISLVIVCTLSASATDIAKNPPTITSKSADILSRTLVLTLHENAPGTSVGAIDVTINIPQGVSVKTKANGLIEADVIYPLIKETGTFLIGKFSNSTLRVAMISPSGIKSGKILQIKTDIAKDEILQAESFQIKSIEAVDLKGKNVNGITVTVAFQ